MSNMSYCRFENTVLDLIDCRNAIEEPDEELSFREENAKRELIEICREIVDLADEQL